MQTPSSPEPVPASRTWLLYLLLLGVSGLAIGGILYQLPTGVHGATTPDFWRHLSARLQSPLILLLFQIVAIVGVAKLAGRLAARCHQPVVIGEIMAGIVLGPSLLGWLWPAAKGWLFPPTSLPPLTLMSELGVLLFLFGIGAELNLERLHQQRLRILLVSHAGIALPFLLGIVSAFALHESFAPPGIEVTTFALFMGIAMSITAFPVLVRILRERHLSGTALGQTATACAAMADVTAWCMLAGVVAIGQSASVAAALPVLGLTLLWCGLLWLTLRPRLQRLKVEKSTQNGALAGLLLLALFSASVTELIGIHALFGAFFAGTLVAGHHDLRKLVLERIEPLAESLLLPLFFASTGLKIQIGLLSSRDWLVCAGLVALATLGKFGGTSLAARLSGSPWRDSLALGFLMNTRGLMEIIVLNVGYDLGFLSARIFAMMVVMALATTLMTGPALAWMQKRWSFS